MDEKDGMRQNDTPVGEEVHGSGDRKELSEDLQKELEKTTVVENNMTDSLHDADTVLTEHLEQNSHALKSNISSPEKYSKQDKVSGGRVESKVKPGAQKVETEMSESNLVRTCVGSDEEEEDLDSNCDLNDVEISQRLLEDGDDVKSGQRNLTGDGSEVVGDGKDLVCDGGDLKGRKDNINVGREKNNVLDDARSESTDTEGDYESADDGEDIEVEEENLRELEETLTDEDKEERKQQSVTIKQEGNRLFVAGSYKSAIKTYNRALNMCPLKFPLDRAMMFSNRAACHAKLENPTAAIKDCSKAIELNPDYVKALIRRAELYEKEEKLDEALADYQKILELDPSIHSARAACMRLPDQIKERNEKLKDEMIGKLKDLGNLVLRPFGLSTDNFQLQQNPETGGYSVNFSQNPQPGNNGK